MATPLHHLQPYNPVPPSESPAMKTNVSGTRGKGFNAGLVNNTHDSGFGNRNYPLPHLPKGRNIDPGFSLHFNKVPAFVKRAS